MAEITVYTEDDDYDVWLEPEGGVHMGLCIGVGTTRQKALADAKIQLMHALVGIEEELLRGE